MEEIKKVRNAEEARLLKEKNAITTDKVLLLINGNVNFGSLIIGEYVSNQVISELMHLGFSVSYKTGQFGENLVKIEW